MAVTPQQILVGQTRYHVTGLVNANEQHMAQDDDVLRPMKCIALNISDQQYVNVDLYPHHAINAKTRTVLRREATIQSQFRQPYVAEFIEVFNIRKHMAVVTERLQGYTIRDYLQAYGWEDTTSILKYDNLVEPGMEIEEDHGHGLSEMRIRPILYSVASALVELNRQSCAHRMVSANNIIVAQDGMSARLKDFRGARRDPTVAQTFVGCEHYLAPEICLRQEVMWNGDLAGFDAHSYNAIKSDVCALGFLGASLRFGFFPFQPNPHNNEPYINVLRRIVHHQACFMQNSTMTPEYRHLLNHMLKNNPAERISMVDVLNHPWFTLGPLPPAREFQYRERQSVEKIEEIINGTLVHA